MKFFSATAAMMLAASAFSAFAEATHTRRLEFSKGKTHSMVVGHVAGSDTVVYKLNARAGQMLKVSMEADKGSADFNIYIPGRGPGDAALFTSATGGRTYTGQLDKTGDHIITVFLNGIAPAGRTAARAACLRRVRASAASGASDSASRAALSSVMIKA